MGISFTDHLSVVAGGSSFIPLTSVVWGGRGVLVLLDYCQWFGGKFYKGGSCLVPLSVLCLEVLVDHCKWF